MERLISLIGLYPYRCLTCSHRFFAFGRGQAQAYAEPRAHAAPADPLADEEPVSSAG